MIKHYFKVAIRNLFKSKTRTIISILGLVAGIFCFTTTNYYARAFYRGNEVFPEFERMAKVYLETDHKLSFLSPSKNITAFKKDIEQVLEMHFDEIEYIAQYNEPREYDISWNNDEDSENLYRVRSMRVNDDFLHVYPARFSEGGKDAFIMRPDAALVTRSFIKQMGTKESVLGKSIIFKYSLRDKIDPPKTYVIVGVIEDYPGYTDFTTFNRHPNVLVKGDTSDECTFLLHKNANLEVMNARLELLHSQENMSGITGRIFIDTINNQRQTPLQLAILGFIGLLVLFTGVINFLSFSIGSFLNRNRELSLRKVLGGQSISLFWLLFVELFLIVAAAIILVIALSEVLYPTLISLLTGPLVYLSVDIRETIWHNVEYGLLIILLCALISFITVARLRLKKSLMAMHRGNATGSKHHLRNTMLCMQLFISMLFLIAAGSCIAQFSYMQNQYEEDVRRSEKNHSIRLDLLNDYFLHENGRNILEHIQMAQWTEVVGAMNYDGVYYTHNGENKRIALYSVTPGYAAFTDKQELKDALAMDKPFCLINESLRKYLEKDSIIGYAPGRDGRTYTVTGTLSGNDYLRGYIPLTDELPTVIFIRVKQESDIHAVKEELTDLIRNFIPLNYEYTVTTEAEMGMEFMSMYGIIYWLFGVCAVISVLISMLGVYGAVSLDTQRRQKEIAIRKVNGADFRDIYHLFGKLYVTIFLIASTLASLAGFAILSFMGSTPDFFRAMFNHRNPVFWILISLVMAAIVFLTVFYRIRQATRVNPSDIIKTE